ncbi:response regulator [Sulfurimonas sp.]|uniref:response regulator n=1 Tax=Sulfurimonas sp. TaxID=2022749 RepID=UPI003D0C58A7
MGTIKVAIVDDEKQILDMLEGFLHHTLKYSVKVYQNPLTALEEIDHKIDIVLLDIMMPQMNGLELLPKLQQKYPDLKVIMMTAYSTLDKVLESHRGGAIHYIMKPFDSLKGLEEKIESLATVS